MLFRSKLRGFWVDVEEIVLTAVFTCSARVLSLRIPAGAEKKKKKPGSFLSCHETRKAVLTECSSNKPEENTHKSDFFMWWHRF